MHIFVNICLIKEHFDDIIDYVLLYISIYEIQEDNNVRAYTSRYNDYLLL